MINYGQSAHISVAPTLLAFYPILAERTNERQVHYKANTDI